MKKQTAMGEYEEFYNDECITILSRHLRREMNSRHGDVGRARAQWREYMQLRSESIDYLKSTGQWVYQVPTDRARSLVDDEIEEI